MKELFSYIFKFDLKSLFVTGTKNPMIQLFRYVFVGGLSFIADSAVLSVLNAFGVNYLIAAIFGFIVGLAVNYLLSIAFVFNGEDKKVSRKAEFSVFAIIAVGGLGLTELLLYIGVDKFGFAVIVAKIIAAGIVMFWNYGMKKLILYSNRKPKDKAPR